MVPNTRFTTKIVAAFALVWGLVLSANAQEDALWDQTSDQPSVSPMPPAITQGAEAYQRDAPPFRRRVMREDISVRFRSLRLDSGKRVTLVYGTPKNVKSCPAVFVLDAEANALANAQGIRIPGLSKRKFKEARQASYLLRSPFGSNMLGNGFGVAYVVADDLDALRSARTKDWIGIFDRVRDLRNVADNSVFLFSTREYANLSIYLTTKYNFSGFVLEEPTYMLFSRDTHEDVIRKADRLTPDEIWNRTDPTRAFRYRELFSQINTPILLIRNPESEAYAFNEKTLIPQMQLAGTYVEAIEIEGPARALTVFGGSPDTGVIQVNPEVAYHAPTISKWVDEMITYMKMNSNVEAVALRDPTNHRNW
ncbi:hypothetical protein [Pelagicoccus sp. SDUM812003]|uniref:hypothetical protein n=1 Tax=Pelagicoccus sp. SDUM812003 TaxID=3041267 RepID=UPI00280ECC0F|nr:hypothetical protein [Pelagicoccus sp. SDUM812003]MDQ8203752.1 hypothetical protein [Pelagicoccus sp. SDUM812003]